MRAKCCRCSVRARARVTLKRTHCDCGLTKHPDVAGCGETPEVDRLGRHPLDGQPGNRRCEGEKGRHGDMVTSHGALCPLTSTPNVSLPHLCSTPHPRCTWTSQSRRASRTLDWPPARCERRCLCHGQHNHEHKVTSLSCKVLTSDIDPDIVQFLISHSDIN